jgi:hypothetical protein
MGGGRNGREGGGWAEVSGQGGAVVAERVIAGQGVGDDAPGRVAHGHDAAQVVAVGVE